MIVTVIAQTRVTNIPESLRGTDFIDRDAGSTATPVEDIDFLAELAGRGCYKSWKMPNPATATNVGYLGNILEQGHYSVFEHGSVTFYVEDVSRALLLELERHRHVSFSVESQRYVNTARVHPNVIVPPAIRPYEGLAAVLQGHYEKSLELYDAAFNELRDAGLPLKEAREAARSFLLESTPVDLFFTGNIRALRDVLGKRWSTHADAEICEFAGLILSSLNKVAPNSVQDISEDPSDN